MPGSSQSKLFLDGHSDLWVVKLWCSPVTARSLINDLFGSLVAKELGIRTPSIALVRIPQLLLPSCGSLGRNSEPVCNVRHFGSKHLLSDGYQKILENIPSGEEIEIENLGDYAGAFAFDVWLSNTDRRQFLLARRPRHRLYEMFFSDQGRCFCGDRWQFADPIPSLRGCSTGTDPMRLPWRRSLDYWITRIEEMSPEKIREMAECVPQEWLLEDGDVFQELVEQLVLRRSNVRSIVANALNDCAD